MKYYVGIDLGGTNIAVGVVNEKNEIVGRAKTKTRPQEPCEIIADDMAKTALAAIEDAKIDMSDVQWIGIGTPGAVNPETGMVEYAGNLNFKKAPLASLVEEKLGKKTYIENDANAASYGEYIAGAAKGVANAVVVTLGTGVGGGIIIDHKIYSGFNYVGGELGHIGIVFNGRPCTCGRRGCFEAYSSATGLINLTKEVMQENKDSKMWELSSTLDKVSGRTAFDAMRMGDKAGKKVVDTYIEYLGYGLTSIINTFQPEILCVGGGICNEGETLLAPLRKYIQQNAFGFNLLEKNTKLVTAALGNDAGIIGAAMLGRLH